MLQVGRVPGDYGFDPLDLEVQIRAIFGYDKVWLHNAELKHGRLGMLAITAFVMQEVLLKIPVLRQDERGIDVLCRKLTRALMPLTSYLVSTFLTFPSHSLVLEAILTLWLCLCLFCQRLWEHVCIPSLPQLSWCMLLQHEANAVFGHLASEQLKSFSVEFIMYSLVNSIRCVAAEFSASMWLIRRCYG